MLPSLDSVNYTLAMLGVLATIAGAWRGTRTWRLRRAEEMKQRHLERERSARTADAILGKGALYDESGSLIEKERPGLVARTASLEEAVAVLVNQDARIKHVEQKTAEHDASIAAILANQIEKAADKNMAAVKKMRGDYIDGEVEE